MHHPAYCKLSLESADQPGNTVLYKAKFSQIP